MKSPGRWARIEAQAKINLGLRILGRDETGYHPLETIFTRIDLADTLTVRPLESGMKFRSSIGLGHIEDNLAFRAGRAFMGATGWPSGLDIELEKVIPVGAGLGGGSADAAAVLRALNALAPTPLTTHELQQVGLTLGADVPFLASELVAAAAQGYGERLTAIEPLRPRPVALAIPDFAVATSEAFQWLDAGSRPVSDRARWTMDNDFTPVVNQRHPQIGELIRVMLDAGATTAEMSGSGSTVFGIFEQKPDARGFSLPPGTRLLWTTTSSRVVEPRIMG